MRQDKLQLIDSLVDQTLGITAEDEKGIVEPFVRHCCEDLLFEDLARAEDADLRGSILTLLELARGRQPGKLNLQIFNPDPDEAGLGADHTVIQFITDDMPFLVDSVTGELNRRELTVHLVMHPQMSVRRDPDGRLCEIESRGASDRDGGASGAETGGIVREEALMHIEVDRQTSPPVLVDLETALHKVLLDVRTAVEDWQPMRRAAGSVLDELISSPPPLPQDEVQEIQDFMRWVVEDHFTFLGYLEYRLEVGDATFLRPVAETGLGLSRHLTLAEQATSERPLTSEAVSFLHGDRLVAISKTSSKSTVHRNVHMDLISVKRFDRGKLAGEYRFLGLFTSKAYSIRVSQIPLVRRKVERVITHTGFPPVSHSAKAWLHIVENYPRDELFQISDDDLYDFVLRILELQLRPQLALLVRRDDENRFVSCMVFVPRDRHSTQLRERMQAILEHAFAGEVTSYSTRISEQPLAQLQFIVRVPPDHPSQDGAASEAAQRDYSAIEARLVEAVRSWSDRLKEVLGGAGGGEAGLKTWRRYREAFPSAYQEMVLAGETAYDIPIIEAVLETGKLGMRLYRREKTAVTRFHFRTFELATAAPLSSFLPMLENMGFTVDAEMPFEVKPAKAANPVWIRDFELVAHGLTADPEEVRERFEDAFARVWEGEVENDGFNRLVLLAGLTWRQVVVLRAYYRYLRQIGFIASQSYVTETLANYPEIVRLLIELFETYFDPRAQLDAGEARADAVAQRIQRALEGVASLDEDRILWRFLNAIQSTLRTNYFQTSLVGTPKDYLSFKLDGSRLRDLPLPRPMFEIFVYSPWVEAVHLRGGKVARGGIRWSDRRDDFRKEILGLVKSQMVKNAVIVPVGAKGGFVVKQPQSAGDRDAAFEEGVQCYQTMIRGMLDITDNRRGEEVVPPPDVVRRDDDDPYLVVAADKGTASFSDIANGVAREYGFWLGDAFASGGSVGYDHKKMAITARGAWESVKRHFREMGRDIQKQDFIVAGVGDMSGDVFGNGMLLSEHIRLVAAFNHLHIFVDPDPDPAVSFAERRRLFELPRSSWSDYDPELLSSGGAVFDRQVKSLTLSPEARELLGVSTETLTPDELIRAILKSKVDLLWFGGIGTYIKASGETNADAADFTNDTLRVDAPELRCAVIGEGANLGLTQAGRIEYARRGGRINTDFIDNSGGVDCSDHEVNIKIVLDDAVAAGELDRAERDRLLADMSSEVADLVLADNYQQSQSISIAEAQKGELLSVHSRLMHNLERQGLLDRRLEGLPDETRLDELRGTQRGLTRPEIAVLLAYSKIFVLGELLDSGLPDEPLLVEDLVRYFPKAMRDVAPKGRKWNLRAAIERHRLRREIIATHVTNSLVNRVGPGFVARLAEETGALVSDVARAYTAARDVFAMRSLWREIEALDNRLSVEDQNRMWLDSIRLVERATRWFLRYGGRPLDISACIETYAGDILLVAAQLEDLLASRAKARVRKRTKRWRERGVPRQLAERVAALDILSSACDVARCSHASGVAVERVGKVYFAVGERFRFDRLRYAASRLRGESPWLQAAVTANLEDLLGHQAQVARQVVSHPGTARQAIKAWVGERAEAVKSFDRLIQDLEAGSVDLAMLTIAERQLRRLVGAPE